MCQDCGLAVVFAEVGQDVHLVGGDFAQADQRRHPPGLWRGLPEKIPLPSPDPGQYRGQHPGSDPHRDCAGRPAQTHGGAQGRGQRKHEPPLHAEAGGRPGRDQGKSSATVAEAGPNPCPPIIVGVGIGGTFERAALLAKKSLLRELGQANPDPEVAAIERAAPGRGQRSGHRPRRAGGPDHRPGGACLDAALPHRLAAGGRQHSMSRLPSSGSGAVKRFSVFGFLLKGMKKSRG